MSFAELVRLLREFRQEMEEAKKIYQSELRTVLPTLIELKKELKRLNDNIERLIAVAEVADERKRVMV